jgi:hypothetical protein
LRFPDLIKYEREKLRMTPRKKLSFVKSHHLLARMNCSYEFAKKREAVKYPLVGTPLFEECWVKVGSV